MRLLNDVVLVRIHSNGLMGYSSYVVDFFDRSGVTAKPVGHDHIRLVVMVK
mgnify:CR=1 FL=1